MSTYLHGGQHKFTMNFDLIFRYYINEASFYSILDMKDRTYINSAAERLCLKLEALDVSKVHISPLKLLAVQVEVSIHLY